jgi:hypothetical protein
LRPETAGDYAARESAQRCLRGELLFIHYAPWNLLVVLLYVAIPLLLLEIITYELVARNRTRLSRWLGMKACLDAEIAQTSAGKYACFRDRGRTPSRWQMQGLQANILAPSAHRHLFFDARRLI